jgi:hypothetical protein
MPGIVSFRQPYTTTDRQVHKFGRDTSLPSLKNKILANTNAMELNAFFGILLLLATAEKRSDETIRNIFLYKISTFSINESNS